MIKSARIFFLLVMLFALTSEYIYSINPEKAEESPQPLEIINITPTGEDVLPTRQITFQFNRPVVPVGLMDRDASEIPIVIEPKVKGQWRWLNTSTLALMFDDENTLLPATHYKISVKPGIKAEDGLTLKETVNHTFITERPIVTGTRFNTWKAPGMPVIRIIFNQPVSKDSIEKHLSIRIKGKEKKSIAFDIKPDPEYEKELERMQKYNDEGYIQSAYPEFMSQYKRKDKFTLVKNGIEYKTLWIVTPKDELPEGSSIEYHIKPGLESVYGPEGGIENRMIDSVPAFPPFSFLGIQCYDDKDKKILIKQDDEGCCCNPDKAVFLVFSSPVFKKEAMENISVEPAIRFGQNDNPEQYYHRPGTLNQKKFEKYIINLPGNFEPMKKYTIKSNSKNIIDVFGRVMDKPFEINFTTGHMRSDYIYTPVVVLEKDADTEMPFYATNLDSVNVIYDRLTAMGEDTALNMEVEIPKLIDEEIMVPVNVRKMLAGHSGIVSGHVETIPPFKENDYSHIKYFLAQVTPFHVHLKESKFSTMVWVTDMATGNPVSDVKVELYEGKDETPPDINNMKLLANGITNAEGIASFPIGLKEVEMKIYSKDAYRRLAARVTKGDDTAFIIDDYFFDVESQKYKTTIPIFWGTTAQGVYRPGDTVQYKIYVRDQDNTKFIPALSEGYGVIVKDPLRKTVLETKDLVLSEFGALQGEFKIPETGTSGEYRFELSTPFYTIPMSLMKILVSDYSSAPFEVTTETDKMIYHTGDNVKISTSAKLHNGGVYEGAGTRVTAMLDRFYDSYYSFFPKDSPAMGFSFDMSYKIEAYETETLGQFEGALDENGSLVNNFNVSSDLLFGKLIMESAVRDERGKYVTEVATAKYSSRDRFVGLKPKDGDSSGGICNKDELCESKILVVDATGEPIPDIHVSINIERREIIYPEPQPGVNLAHSSELEKWTGVESHTVRSGNKPIEYSFYPKEAGNYRVTASLKDSMGREHRSGIPVYVYDKPKFRNGNNENKLEIVPDKRNYNVGDTARYTIKNPFPGAKALISIERNGIINHRVQTLDAVTHVIDVKIEKDYFPEYYLSVVVMSPAHEDPSDGKNNKSGKPVFKMGYIKTTLDEPYKELSVEAKPLKETYQPGDKVKVDVHVAQRSPHSDEPVELAVVVLNDDIFQLLKEGKDYFDPYKGFYSYFGLGVQNYNLLSAYLGLRNFVKQEKMPFEVSDSLFVMSSGLGGVEKKDSAPKVRSNLKSVAYWNPSIIPDSKGNASIEFEAPDNLTGWHIFTMAVTPTDQMGLGDGHFAVAMDTEIRPVIPNQVMEGDSFSAGFSIMNRTDKTRELTMTITAEGAIESDQGKSTRKVTQTVSAEPYKRNTVWLPLKTKGSGKIKFTAKGGDSVDQDGLVHELEVRKMVTLETTAKYGTTVDGAVIEQLHFPDDIRADVGEVKVSLTPTVIGQVDGTFKYLRDYPYSCWEQILTKGVMANHYQYLKRYMPDEFTWEGSEGLTRDALAKVSAHQAPNGGMAYYTPEDSRVSPYLSAYTAIAFGWLEDRGYKIPSVVQERLNGYLLDMLKKDEIPDFYSAGMASTVRAVALAALAKQGKVTIDDLKFYYPYVKKMDLFGKAHFLLAAVGVAGSEAIQKEVFNMILSQADQTGGKFIFNESLDDSYSRILTSSLRTNSAILSSFIAYGKTEEGKDLVGGIPFKMVRYITQTRKQSGRWENTQENIFCMNALIEYSKAYENVKPDMKIVTFLDNKIIGDAIFNGVRDNTVVHTKPIEKKDPGRKSEVIIERKGKGRLYYSVGMDYAPLKPNTEPINAGIDIKREYSVERDGEWVLLKSPMEIKRGEIVRVDLFVSLPSARNFVVVDDPVPGGLEPVNSDLATSSLVDADKGKFKPARGSWWFHYGDWSYYGMSRWSFYHRELRHHAARFYSEYLPAGNYHLSYTAQAIASGEFTVMPTHAEEMYDPDVFGKSSAGILKVGMED